MIIKSIGNKSKSSFGKLLSYITRDKAAMKGKNGVILLKHNINGNSLEELKTAFLTNERNRRHVRTGVNIAYHEILSFDQRDTPLLTQATLEDLTQEYLRLRGEACVAVATYHADKKHRHIHVILSGVECESGKAIRVSKERFREIKESLQIYQQQHYPTLVSVVNHGKQDKARQSENEYQLKARTGKASRKDEIKAVLNRAFDQAFSLSEFYDALAEQGLTLYERNGKITGIDDNRHYRFSTLGYDNAKLQEFTTRAERLTALENIRADNGPSRETAGHRKETFDTGEQPEQLACD